MRERLGSGRHLIIEADGGSRGNPGPAGYGALVREPGTGQVLAERAEAIDRATNNVAEYRGLIAGLEAAAEFAPSLVEVRMDSKLVVEQMSGRWKIKHPDMKSLALQAQRLVAQLPRVTFTWIPREQNAAADRLANQAMDGVPIGAANPSVKRRSGAGPADRGLGPGQGRVSALPAATPQTPPAAQSPMPDTQLAAPTRLYLLRHGVTVHTPQRRFSERNDLALTADGRAQISAAATRLAGLGSIRAVLSSPLRRTQDSAQIVADALHLPIDPDDDLVELDFGRFEGLTWVEAQAEHSDDLSAFRSSAEVAAPGGEAISDVRARMDRFLARVLDEYAGVDVAVLTHMTPIKVLLCVALDVPLTTVNRIFLGPASLSIIEWFADGRASVTLVNDTSHWEGR